MQREVEGSDYPFVRAATREDCLDLAKRLRKEDVKEIALASGSTPEEALLRGFAESHLIFSVVLSGEVVAIFGVLGWQNLVGYPWMLASDSLTKIRRPFLRHCGKYVHAFLRHYRRLENVVWAENAEHIKWLKWLGFQFEEAQPYGYQGEPFHRFYLKDKDV